MEGQQSLQTEASQHEQRILRWGKSLPGYDIRSLQDLDPLVKQGTPTKVKQQCDAPLQGQLGIVSRLHEVVKVIEPGVGMMFITDIRGAAGKHCVLVFQPISGMRSSSPTMADLTPPFTQETAVAKVKFAQNMWNTRDPEKVVRGYTKECIWRNRDHFIKGSQEIKSFLSQKWEKEQNYRLRKEIFALGPTPAMNKIAVQFWYEYQDAHDGMKWKRCYGLEDWTFVSEGPEKGKMEKRMMSGNDVLLGREGDGVSVGETGEEGWVEGRWFVGDEEGGICTVKEVDDERVTKLLTDRHY